MSANWCRRSGPRTDCAPFHLSQARSAAVASDYAPLRPEHDEGIAALWRAVLKQALTDAAEAKAARRMAQRGAAAAGGEGRGGARDHFGGVSA